jgi:hypothetical protein
MLSDNQQNFPVPLSQTRSTSWNMTWKPAVSAKYTEVVLNHIMRLNVSSR